MATSTKPKGSKNKGKKTAPAVSVTVAQFDSNRFETIRRDIEIGDFTPVRFDEYTPLGATPLRDATAKFIGVLDGLRRKGAVTIGLLADASGSMSPNREQVVEGINQFVEGMADVDAVDPKAAGRVLCVVLTDGLENASREMSAEALRALIADREADGWTLIYMGANQDAWAEGSNLGLSGGASGQQVNYVATAQGTSAALRNVADHARSYLGDQVAYAAAAPLMAQRSVGEDGVEVAAPVASRKARAGMGGVGKESRERSYGNVSDALKAAQGATRS